MPNLIECNTKMFADDTNMYSVIKSFDDSLKLQDDIDRLMQWSSIYMPNVKLCNLVIHSLYHHSRLATMKDCTTNVAIY